ncbi:transcription factor HES-3 [Pteropus vampyrus]|uniref:Transcription factor HES-3 n=1 Tax=Pteropus vampyrus TaxID=132908 RepID=A0A6P3QPP6_PTEVA|nr:transcription factor HES-3 [Pteropus vampyrus]
MEKKRRARINVSLEQLKSLLEKHYSHQIRKRKLEKADILELSVKYMKSLQNSVQGLWPVPSGAEYPSGFGGCLSGVRQLLRRGEDGDGGLRCPLVHECAVGSTTDSVSPGPDAPAPRSPCAPAVWAPDPAAGGSQSRPPWLFLSGGTATLDGAGLQFSALLTCGQFIPQVTQQPGTTGASKRDGAR